MPIKGLGGFHESKAACRMMVLSPKRLKYKALPGKIAGSFDAPFLEFWVHEDV